MSAPDYPRVTVQEDEDVFRELASNLGKYIPPSDIDLGRVKFYGSSADVFDATMSVAGLNKTKRVAVKKFRIHVETFEKSVRSFSREIRIWGQLEHENILPLLGITVLREGPCTISEWMENGTLDTYLKTCLDVDNLEMARGIACGLEFLHHCDVVHSDLKSDNVLISDDGRPVLSDFGISRRIRNNITITGTSTLNGNYRWMAPELMIPDLLSGLPDLHTKATDVWAFGMVVYQILSNKFPFDDCRLDHQVIAKVTNQCLPDKPDYTSLNRNDFDTLWHLCCMCWNADPLQRPTMAEVKAWLKDDSHSGIAPLIAPKERTHSIQILSESQLPDHLDPTVCRLSPTGEYLAIKTKAQQVIALWETSSNTQSGPGFTSERVYAIAWSHTEQHIITASWHGLIRKWSHIFESPTLVAEHWQDDYTPILELSPDDTVIASVGESSARLLDAMNFSLIWKTSAGLKMYSGVALHPFECKAFVFSKFFVEDVSFGNARNIVSTGHAINMDQPSFPRVHKLGDTCAVSSNRAVTVIHTKQFTEQSTIYFAGCRSIQYTPDGRYIFLVLDSKRVILWDIEEGRVVDELTLDIECSNIQTAEVSKSCNILRLAGEGSSFIVCLKTM